MELILKDGKKMLAYSGGASSGMFEIYTLIGDYLDCGVELGKVSSRTLITISSIKSIKVRSISILGKVS